MKFRRIIEIAIILGSTPFIVPLQGCHEDRWHGSCMCLDMPAQAEAPEVHPPAEIPVCHWTNSFDFIMPDHEWIPANHAVQTTTAADDSSSGNIPSDNPQPIHFASHAKTRTRPIRNNVPSNDISTGCVDINIADEKQLTSLPGVGAGRALAIIQARTKKRFKRKKDITRVKGIGPQSYRKMADLICDIAP